MRTNLKRIKNCILDHFDHVELEKYCRDTLRVIFRDEVGEFQGYLLIQLTDSLNRMDQGIHMGGFSNFKAELDERLPEVIDQALKDNYTYIYVHQTPKESESRDERLNNSIEQWIEKILDIGSARASFNSKMFTYNYIDILNSMNQDQKQVLLSLISGVYGVGYHNSREFNKKLKNLKGA